MILKTLINNLKGAHEHPELSNDTLITLSQIESGCLFIPLGENVYMLIKSTQNEIADLKKLSRITINTELIERPEFPTVALYMSIHTEGERSYNFEYYFNIEASEELGLLEKLSAQKNLGIILYDERIEHSAEIRLTDEDKSGLASLLVRARGLV